ncbi:MAG: pilus assembly protein FimV [Methylophagaceae bacterium]|jgi:pilus assembly protein FimV
MKTRVFTMIGMLGGLVISVSMPAYSLGLGKIELSSALNEPFKAEIPVIAASGEEAETLQVRLASSDEFERAGLVKDETVNQLKFEVSQKADKAVIMVSSKKPIREPLLDFLLLAKTNNGQLIREYTVLLDPPKHIFKDAMRASKGAASATIAQSNKVVSQSSHPAANKMPHKKPLLAGSKSYGETSRTDTLWDIALKTRPSHDVSIHQMMIALVKQNERAFINQNINGLKSGYTLMIPSADEIRQLNKQQAVSVVKQQNSAWKNRNTGYQSGEGPTASVVASQRVKPDALQDLKVEEVLPTLSVPEPARESAPRLQLLGSNDDKVLSDNDLAPFGNEKVQKLSDQLTLAQEVIEGQQQENIDIKSRMAAMEEQIQTLRKLISLQDPDLAKLQSKLEQEAAEAGKRAKSPKLDELTEQIQADLNVEETLASNEQNIELDDSMTKVNERDSDALAVVDSQVVVASLDDITKPHPLTLLEKIQAFLTEHKLQALLGVLGLLLALFFIGRKRAEDEEKVSWDQAVENIKSPAVPLATQPSAPIDDTKPVPDVEPEPLKTVNDSIKDADIYVSYGDYDKAGQVLKAAHNDVPSDMVIIQKLLFTYYKQGDSQAFTELARRYNVDRESMEWIEVADWGREIDADELLFAEPVVEEPVIDLAELESGLTLTLDEDIEGQATTGKIGSDSELLDFTTELDTTETLDINDDDVNNTAVEVDLETDTVESNELSFSSEFDENSSDINGLDAIKDSELEAATIALSGEEDANELEFDLSDFDQIDEAETKLDLARAYVEMGDPDGAKSILEEVVAEGDASQQSRAKTLLNELS